jgi:hypothetical protein
MLIARKFSGGPNGLSVFKNSNIAFSSTEDNFGGVRPNSFLKFDNSDILYSIISTKRILFSKEFESLGNRRIKLNSDLGLKIQNEDGIRLVCDEYELDYVFEVKNGGNYYAENDVISIKGGELSINLMDGIGTPASLIVNKTDRDGGIIKSVEIKNRGKYYVSPDNEPENYGSKSGTGAKFKLKFRKTETQEFQEKVIKNIEVKDNETILTLDYSLNPGIKSGQISFEKWEVILSQPFLNDSTTNLKYKVFSEFTPNYSFPLTIKNNPDIDLIFNEAMNKIDAKIKELDDKLILLKGI